MSKLITEIEKEKLINCPQTTNFYSESYQKICAEEKKMRWRLCREIHNYRPEKEVFTVNVWRFTYAAGEYF